MKNLYHTSIAYILSGLILSSCTGILDISPSDRYTEDTGYQTLQSVDKIVEGMYGILYTGNVTEINGDILTDQYTDLIKNSSVSVPASNSNRYFFTPNLLSPETMPLNCWADMYERLPRVNEFIVDIHNGKLSHIDKKELQKREGEARFLRAFAFNELINRHGRFVLRAGEEAVDDYRDRNKPLLETKEGWDYILSEYRKAAEMLPDTWEGREGRITSGAAWGMIARGALYAGRWNQAIEACQKVEAMNYALLDEYAEIFQKPNNKEVILSTNFEAPRLQHYFTMWYCPPGDHTKLAGSIGAIATPTEEFASAYEINVGGVWQAFNWDLLKEGTITDPYANRDPRFYQTIFHNGQDWKCFDGEKWTPRKLEIYKGGRDGFARYQDATDVHLSTTGYLIRKYIREEGEFNFGSVQSDQFWIEMRLPEIYLIHSEALARKGSYTQAYEYLNKLRTTRKSVQLSTLSPQQTWEGYLNDLSLERIRELGMEGHRFWDLRRWGQATKVLHGKRMHGVMITPTGTTQGFKYEQIDVDGEDRFWPQHYNIFPIPKRELDTNSKATQNEQWL